MMAWFLGGDGENEQGESPGVGPFVGERGCVGARQ
jgi:hypothetical protein